MGGEHTVVHVSYNKTDQQKLACCSEALAAPTFVKMAYFD